MELIERITEINFANWTITAFLIVSIIIAIFEIIKKVTEIVSEVIGKPVKWVKSKNKDHQLLLETSQKLSDLKEKHEESVKQSIRHDEMIKNGDENIDKSALMAESGLGYYNVSGISFHDLTTDTQKIYANIKKLIESFSDNITAIFDKKGLDLVNTCSVINEKKALEEIVNKFDKMDLSKEAMNNADMGAFFGELVVMVYGTVENGENWTA